MTIETNNENDGFPFYHSSTRLTIGTTDGFFEDLESILRKHLGDDWEWKYDGDHPLYIFSSKLSEMWEKEIDDDG